MFILCNTVLLSKVFNVAKVLSGDSNLMYGFMQVADRIHRK